MLPSQTWYEQGPRHVPFGQDVAKFYFVIVVVDRCADLIGKLLEFVEIGIRLRPIVAIRAGPSDRRPIILSGLALEELEAAIKEPMKISPNRNVGIHESAVEDARRGLGDGAPMKGVPP
jgi:hypothetical protein